jgi:hemerythrin
MNMPFVEWDNDLTLGIRQIDEHHRHLVDLLNKSHDSFVWGRQAGDQELILNELTDYAFYHFKTEEDLMKSSRYPGLETHQGEHEIFRNKLSEFQNNKSCEAMQGYLDILTFLLEWLITHIKTTDRQFCAYLTDRGVT